MADVLIGLGSNVGDRLDNLRSAVDGLRPVLRDVQVSSVYETTPVGRLDQPSFLNAVLRGAAVIGPQRLFFWAKSLEFTTGRRPGPTQGPRQLDLDIIAWGDLEILTARLHIPHRAFSTRAFVLAPMAELAPDLILPGAEATVRNLDVRVGRAGVAWAYPSTVLTAPR